MALELTLESALVQPPLAHHGQKFSGSGLVTGRTDGRGGSVASDIAAMVTRGPVGRAKYPLLNRRGCQVSRVACEKKRW